MRKIKLACLIFIVTSIVAAKVAADCTGETLYVFTDAGSANYYDEFVGSTGGLVHMCDGAGNCFETRWNCGGTGRRPYRKQKLPKGPGAKHGPDFLLTPKL